MDHPGDVFGCCLLARRSAEPSHLLTQHGKVPPVVTACRALGGRDEPGRCPSGECGSADAQLAACRASRDEPAHEMSLCIPAMFGVRSTHELFAMLSLRTTQTRSPGEQSP